MKTQDHAHTPTPWTYHLGRGVNPRFHIQNEGGYQIASTTELVRHSQAHEENAMREANAAYIVRAVNLHEELVQELKKAADMCRYDKVPKTVEHWDALIAKAEGGK